MYIIFIIFLLFIIVRNNKKETFDYKKYLIMDKLSTNIVKLKGLLTLNSDIKTNKFCIEDYCIEENDLIFMDNMPRYNKNKLWFSDVTITENDFYNLKNYWFENMIVMYYGDPLKIPQGWALCNGSNGTPDLREKFIIGSGGDYKVYEPGGKKEVSLKMSNLPKHRHNFNPRLKVKTPYNYDRYNGDEVYNIIKKGGYKNSHAYIPVVSNSNENDNSSVGLNVTSTGEGKPHDNMPPYYSLYYIIKIKEL